jgi:hypothetical protein
MDLLKSSIPCLLLFAKTFDSLLDPIVMFLSELQSKLHHARADPQIMDLQSIVLDELARIHNSIIQPI